MLLPETLRPINGIIKYLELQLLSIKIADKCELN